MALAAVLLPVPALADETDPPAALELSGAATIVSDFRFRGISQSDRRPALQGTLGLNHISGAHASVFASSIDERTRRGADAQVELTGGWRIETAGGLGVDVGARYYLFPGGRGATDFVEPYASLSYSLGPATAELSAHYAPKQRALALADGRSRDNLYVRAGLSAAVPNTPLTARAHIGHSYGPSAMNLASDYNDWGLGLRWVAGSVTLGLDYADTDRAVRTARGRTLGGAGVIGSVSVGF